jgi:hypothetical protein
MKKDMSEFKRELEELLDKHGVKLILSCEDMTAYLSLDMVDSHENLICEQTESMHDQTIVNDYLISKASES